MNLEPDHLLTNYSKAIAREALEARCDSYMCIKGKKKGNNNGNMPGVPKNVNRNETWCPDCGCALYWGYKRGQQ